MSITQAIVVLVYKPDTHAIQGEVQQPEDPLDGVEVFQVFTETEEDFVQDYLLKLSTDHPGWQFSMQGTNVVWHQAHLPGASERMHEKLLRAQR